MITTARIIHDFGKIGQDDALKIFMFPSLIIYYILYIEILHLFKLDVFPLCLFDLHNSRGLETPCVSHDGLWSSWQQLKEEQIIKI